MRATPTQNQNRAARASRWWGPTPPAAAIEIAAGRITVAQVSVAAGAPVVSAYASEPIASDRITPALLGRNIADASRVIDTLGRVLERAGLAGVRRAAPIVPDSIARVSLLPFEQIPHKPGVLDQLIRWQLRKSTPFPLE